MSYDSTGLFLKLQALLAQHPRLSILEASRLLGVHRHTLSLVIERHGGIVPRTWRDQAALERVWRALRDFPDLPIKAIASTAGFSNGTSLARFTKRVCKMSPSQLRTCNQLPPVAEASAREDG